jgi:short-subunit dehydrogenase
MSKRFKPLEEQVVVVTGASSGIGLATAEMAAERGARVVLVARSEDKLRTVEARLKARGLEALAVVADVSRPDEVEAAAHAAAEAFGGIDTWVSNAAESVYGRVEEVSLSDVHRLFEVNYFGVVNGAKAALPRLRHRGAGVLIHVGSVVSDAVMPLLGHYAATKHAVKAFTDALRMELEREGAPIAVCLVKPGSINTPFTQHSKSYLEREPDWAPPVYAPEVVARAILACAERPRRDVVVGGAARLMSAAARHGRLADAAFGPAGHTQQMKDRPSHRGDGALYAPIRGEAPTRYGDYEGHVLQHSTTTAASMHPWRTTLLGAAALGAGLGLAALLGNERSGRGWAADARGHTDAHLSPMRGGAGLQEDDAPHGAQRPSRERVLAGGPRPAQSPEARRQASTEPAPGVSVKREPFLH